MRSVSNWDWTNNTVPQGTVVSGSATSFTLNNVSGAFQNGDYVTVWDNTTTPSQIGNAQLDSFSGSTLNLTAPGLSFTPSAGSIVQRAAALGAPASVNFDNATATPVDYRISNFSDPTTKAGNAGSVWVNGGLIWFGKNFTII